MNTGAPNPDHAPVRWYGHWICPFATRVKFALAQRGVPHTDVIVPPTGVRPKDFEFPPEFLEHSPRREIPMVGVGDEYLADSIPVLEWLEEVLPQPGLLPSDDVGRARVRERMARVDRTVFRAMIGVYYGTTVAGIAEASARLAAALGEVEGWLDDSDWLGGDGPTLVEAVHVPVIVRLDGLRRLGFDGDLPERVADHARRCTELPGWAAAAWTDEQTDEFVGRFEAYRRHRSSAAT